MGGDVGQIRVLIVDESRDFIDGVSAWLRGEPSVSVVGSARSFDVALIEMADLRPDLVLLDAATRPFGGFAVARRIRELHPGVVVVVTSVYGSTAARKAALAAGADHFIEKSQVHEGLMSIVRGMHPRDEEKKSSG